MTPNNQDQKSAKKRYIDIAAFRKKNRLNLQDIADILGWSRSSVKREEEGQGWRRILPSEVRKIFDAAQANGWDTVPLNPTYARFDEILRYVAGKGMSADFATEEGIAKVKYGEIGITDDLAWRLSCLCPELDVEWMKTGEGSMFVKEPAKWINANEAAEILGVTTSTVRNYAKKGVLHIRDNHGFCFYPLAEVKALAGYDKIFTVEQIRANIDELETEMAEKLVITQEQYDGRVKEFRAFLSDNDKTWYSFHAFISKSLSAIFQNNFALKEDDWKIINGLLDLNTLQQVADEIGMSRERVRQKAMELCKKLRTLSVKTLETPVPKPKTVLAKEYHIGEFERFMLSPCFKAYEIPTRLFQLLNAHNIHTVEDLYLNGNAVLRKKVRRYGEKTLNELKTLLDKVEKDVHAYGYRKPEDEPVQTEANEVSEMYPVELLDSPLEKHVFIPTRIRTAFRILKVVTIRDLTKLDLDKFRMAHGIGRKSMREFNTLLNAIHQKLEQAKTDLQAEKSDQQPEN